MKKGDLNMSPIASGERRGGQNVRFKSCPQRFVAAETSVTTLRGKIRGLNGPTTTAKSVSGLVKHVRALDQGPVGLVTILEGLQNQAFG